MIGPRHFKVSGPSIYLGQDVHVMALPEAPVRLSVFEEMGRIEVADYTLINPGARVTSAERISGEGCMSPCTHLSMMRIGTTCSTAFSPGSNRACRA